MSRYRIVPVGGEVPRLDRRNIREGFAAEAANVLLTAGRLDPMGRPKEVAQHNKAVAKTIYRMFDKNRSYWLAWNEHVSVAETPVYVENDFRICFSSEDFEPRQTNLTLASDTLFPNTYPAKWYVLGVHPPKVAPAVTPAAGGGTTESRAYVYTFVNAWGEESAPSPASTVASGNGAGTWTVTLPSVAPPNTFTVSAVSWATGVLSVTLNTVEGLRAKEQIELAGLDAAVNGVWRIATVNSITNVITILHTEALVIVDQVGIATRVSPHNTVGMTKRVYRSVTTDGSTGEYVLVGDNIAASTTTFNDLASTVVGEPLATLGWQMPPADLEGLVLHPSGSMVGFVGNNIYISEPYATYAWPEKYVQTLDFPAVAQAVSGQSVVIATTGRPYVLSFSDPENATAQKVDQNWPGKSKRGMVAFEGGVFYPTTVGLASISAAGSQLVTQDFYAQRDWAGIEPDTFVAGFYDGYYYAIFSIAGSKRIFIFSVQYGVIILNIAADALYTDRETGELYISVGSKIKQLHAVTDGLLEYTWQTKTFVEPKPINLGIAKIDFDVSDIDKRLEALVVLNEQIISTNEAAIAGSAITGSVAADDMLSLDIAGSEIVQPLDVSVVSLCTFTLIADGKQVFQRNIGNSEPFRLPMGLKYDNFSIRVSGTARVTSLLAATTAAQLKTI